MTNTNTTDKMTNRVALKCAIKLLNGDNMWCVKYDPAEVVTKLEGMIASLDKKSSTPRKPSATQTENEALKSLIVDYLSASDSMYTIKELQSAIPELSALSNQRVSHLLKALREAKIVKRFYVKKIAFFSLGVEEDTAEE